MRDSAVPAPAWVTHPWVAANAANVSFGIANGPRGDWPALVEFVAEMEELGYDAFWSSDHPVLSSGCWTTLAGLAATTTHLRLGSLVACLAYQNPVVLARTALDIDAMSGGRLVVGLGIGDIEREFVQMGIPWHGTRERQHALDEVVGLLRYLWGERLDPPVARHYAVSAPPLSPRPVQHPRIPLLIAGGGQTVTLRQVAQHADASNFGEHAYTGGVQGHSAILQRMTTLAQHCHAYGRAPESVLRTHTTYPLVLAPTASRLAEKIDHFVPKWVRDLGRDTMVAGPPAVAVTHFARLIGAGLQHFIAFVYGNDLETIRLLAQEVIPELRRPQAAAGSATG
ncbi:MAG: LLM class flavin-dependent oxidoreductase [Thermomicrobiales bacterium]|nr:LLM class flavin-dependent oxidoreductase [Thermomicrobiales bacterium]